MEKVWLFLCGERRLRRRSKNAIIKK